MISRPRPPRSPRPRPPRPHPPPPASDSAVNRKRQISVGTAGPQLRVQDVR